MRKAQKVEGLRSAEPSRAVVRLGEPSKLNQPGLVRVQVQFEPVKPVPQGAHESLRILPVLESDHEIVGVAHNDLLSGLEY